MKWEENKEIIESLPLTVATLKEKICWNFNLKEMLIAI